MSKSSRPWKGVAVSIVIALIVLLIGCGGGGGGGGGTGATATAGVTGATNGNAGQGTVNYTIQWPVQTRSLPPYALSVVISVFNFGTTDLVDQQTINRDQTGAYNQTVAFTLPTGKYTIVAEARPEVNGGGDTMASDSLTIDVSDGGTQTTTLNFTDLVAKLFIDDLPPSATVGQTIQLSAHAQDSQGNAILLPANALDWSIVSGSDFASITSDGKLTLNSPGSVTIQVREIVTNVTTTKSITLTQGSTNGVIIIVS